MLKWEEGACPGTFNAPRLDCDHVAIAVPVEKYVESADRIGAYAQVGSPTAVLLTVRYNFKGVSK